MAEYKKPKEKLDAAEEANLARRQWEAYTRARDHGHTDYIEIAKQCDAFYRGENVTDIQGSGLGLSIVKQFIELHGGTIQVKSVVNQGTTFTVMLPIRA